MTIESSQFFRKRILNQRLSNSASKVSYFRALIVATLSMFGLPGIVLGQQANGSPGNNVAQEKPAIVREFEAIAKKLEQSNNEYYGSADLKRLLAVDISKVRGKDLYRLNLMLSWHHLRLGNVEKAVEHADAVMEMRRKPYFSAKTALMCRALANLRLAEVNNCIKQHNCDCCIFPLTGGGVHVDRAPAKQAKRDLMEYLKSDPKNLHVTWILNLLCMALGEHPQGLPLQFRIPASAFKSDVEFPRFKDVATKLGVDTFNLCGGAMVEDFDGDARLDIVTSSYDPKTPLTYYRNAGDGSFSDESASSTLNQQYGGLNCIAADYDNDGDKDILVLRGAWLRRLGRIRNSLLQNDGKGNFVDVTKSAGLADVAFPTQSGVWGDFNADGHLDLYVVNESKGSKPADADYYPAQLYINQGNGTFVDQAKEFGVTNDRFGKGATAGDFDNDGDLDIYVSNIGKNRLYRNEGNKAFVDVAAELNVTQPDQRSFATWFFDFNNDGALDIFVTAYSAIPADLARHYLGQKHRAERSRLYLNKGDGTFREIGKDANLDFPCLPMGANFGDIDHDGWLDVYLTTGDPQYQTLMPNVMLKNDGGKSFLDVTTAGGFGHLQKGHGIAFADIDNDGDQDLYHQLGGFFPGDKFQNALFENPGNDNKFLTLKLVGEKSNRDSAGARVEVVVTEGGKERSIHRALGSVSSFGGSPSRLEIGLGEAESINSVRIKWPGSTEAVTYEGFELDAHYRIVEGGESTQMEFSTAKWK